MLGTVGEYIVESSNTTDNIVDKIKEYELSLVDSVPSSFYIKQLGILPSAACTIKVNGRNFYTTKEIPLELGYNMMDVTKIVAQDEGVKLTIRYLY